MDRPAERAAIRWSPGEGRKFAFTLALAFGILAGITWWRGGEMLPRVFGAVAGAFGIAGLVAPGHLGPVHRAWMGMAHAISKVTTPIFMGIIYFLVITPTGWLRRTLGGNPLRQHRGSSAWVDRSSSPKGDLTRQF
jgi:hypothetical protein